MRRRLSSHNICDTLGKVPIHHLSTSLHQLWGRLPYMDHMDRLRGTIPRLRRCIDYTLTYDNSIKSAFFRVCDFLDPCGSCYVLHFLLSDLVSSSFSGSVLSSFALSHPRVSADFPSSVWNGYRVQRPVGLVSATARVRCDCCRDSGY